MSNDEIGDFPSRRGKVLLPKQFYSVAQGAPFSTCIQCDAGFFETGKRYLIEKARRGQETIFEFAACIDCVMQIHEGYSRESRLWMETFFEERVDWLSRDRYLRSRPTENVDAWLEHCVACRRPRVECSEYQVYAMCFGRVLILEDTPWLLCGDCVEVLANGLSNRTIGDIERWVTEHLSPPPEYVELLHDRKFVL